MSFRFRLEPTAEQARVLRMHCNHARFIWNLGIEQHAFSARYRRRSKFQTQEHNLWNGQLTEIRGIHEWLAEGSSVVQQAALRDLHQAWVNRWTRPDHFRKPTRRTRKGKQGFAAYQVPAEKLNADWGQVRLPKAGWVKFRMHRNLAEFTGVRVTVDTRGQWHVSFTNIPELIEGPGDGSVIGLRRGVNVGFQSSDGRSWTAPGLSDRETKQLVRLRRKGARQQQGSKQWWLTMRRIAKLKATERLRRKDMMEKATTELASTCDIIRVADLQVIKMLKSAKGTVEDPGTNVQQKRDLNRGISGQGWAEFVTRLGQKVGEERLQRVPAPFTAQRCFGCGHVAEENLVSFKRFRCVSCGREASVALNGAQNISVSEPLELTAREQKSLDRRVASREKQFQKQRDLAELSGGSLPQAGVG